MENNSASNIRKIFSEIPNTYELINHVLTFGLDSYWRRKAASVARRQGGRLWLDVCSGTGDMAKALQGASSSDTRLVSLDFCLPMLRRAVHRIRDTRVSFCAADAGCLPFAGNTFDLVIISFATRNINSNKNILLHYFKEFYRVLKPGGMFVNVETSQPRSFVMRKFLHWYARFVIKPVGSMISGSKPAYAYLSHTIPRFFEAGQLLDIISQAGFSQSDFHSMTFGISAIHTATK